MDVQLYVYDLTNGLARQMSRQFLGIQIDAVYHTALVIGGIEYFFGAGVQTCYAGQTHHGQPMEKISLGSTQLPMEVILDYLESLKEVYTPESYDLFAHNCNNFTNDFAMFLVGRGIPDHITSLPKRVLDTPFGQMLRPQIEAGMRGVTQAPVAPQNVPRSMPATNGTSSASSANGQPAKAVANGMAKAKAAKYGKVVNLTSLSVLEKHLQEAKETASTIFFTSSTCAPCKLAHPTYDSLAEGHPNCLFVKVDCNEAREIASRYSIRATPSFLTFSKSRKLDEWSGADPNLLKLNVEKAVTETFPPHPHSLLKVPTLQYGSLKPVTYAKVPPLEKLMSKLSSAGQDPQLTALKGFIQAREKDAREATLPDLGAVGEAMRSQVLTLPIEVRFAAVDLFRCAIIDARVSGFFAEEAVPQTVPTLLKHITELGEKCPHNLRLVTLHLACNCFSSHLFVRELFKPDSTFAESVVQLITSSLLDNSHSTTRISAAWLAFNVASANYRARREDAVEGLAEALQVELAASLLETVGEEKEEDAVKALLFSLGYLLHCAPRDGELVDLCQALDAKSTVAGVKCKGQEKLVKEVTTLL